jgi:hypothetical protein
LAVPDAVVEFGGTSCAPVSVAWRKIGAAAAGRTEAMVRRTQTTRDRSSIGGLLSVQLLSTYSETKGIFSAAK